MSLKVTYGSGVVTIKPTTREGEIDRDPLVLRNYNEAFKLAFDLCAALVAAWPGADRIGVER